jgi:hypothetical protein
MNIEQQKSFLILKFESMDNAFEAWMKDKKAVSYEFKDALLEHARQEILILRDDQEDYWDECDYY